MRYQNTMLLIALLGTAGCTTDQYSNGINSFSQAVTKADVAEQSVAAAEQTALENQWTKQSSRESPRNISLDLGKCSSSEYHAGDCSIKSSTYGAPPLGLDQSSMSALKSYAELLNSIAQDKTCASLQSDSKDIAAAIQDLGKDAGQTAIASAASPLATLVSTTGCWLIDQRRLSVLRQATSDAAPIINQIIPIISDKDKNMVIIIVNDELDQLSAAKVSFDDTGSENDLRRVVRLTRAVDEAKTLSLTTTIEQIATLHNNLVGDLQAQTVNLQMIQSNAQTLINDAETITEVATKLENTTR